MLTFRSIAKIANPPYLFRPIQMANRVWRELTWRSSDREVVRLPWGLAIVINPHEAIGHNIATRGVYDLAVTETLWRLADPGELVVDAGANIGYTASLLAVRAGARGRVLCFEPHPEVFVCLQENVSAWKDDARCGAFLLRQTALGGASSVSTLETSDSFGHNRGTARVAAADRRSAGGLSVQVERLDDVLRPSEEIGVMKIDAEGAELEILRGMQAILAARRVRDIVFEETNGYPAATHKFLASRGYMVFGLQAGLFGVRCLRDAPPKIVAQGDPPNYLATIAPERALERLGRHGWRSFGILSGIGADN